MLLGGKIAGQISRTRSGLVFVYDPAYAGSTPLSPALPVSWERRYREIDAFIEGVLPDDADVRARWAARLAAPNTAFDLLTAMGQYCAGAVQFATDATVDDVLGQRGSYEPVDHKTIGRRLTDLRRETSGWTMPAERWSLAGAQPKFTLARIDGRWNEPIGSAPSTHIIKPGVVSMNHQAAVEFATMRVARRIELLTAEVELGEFAGQEAAVIKRFDRIVDAGGRVHRLHQVDLRQASGVPPSNKYKARGGPRGGDLAALIRRTSTDHRDAAAFSRALIFNYLAGCPDGHAKNFSIIYAGTRVRLAPMYDVATGLPYDRLTADTTSAFSIGGVRRFGEAYEKHWLAHASEFGIDPGETLDFVRSTTQRLPDEFRDVLTGEVGGDLGRSLWRRMSQRPGHIAKQSRQLLDRLTGDPATRPEEPT